MQYRRLSDTGLEVSALCLGTMTFGEQNSEEEAFEQLDMALDSGVNFIDTAEIYSIPPRQQTMGSTERIIGRWLQQRGCRDKLVIATKVAGPGRDWLPYIRGGDNRLRVIVARFERAVAEEVLPYLQETHPGASIVTEALATVPPLEPERHGAAEELARRLTGSNTTEVVAYGTEGGHFQKAGLSVVVCGPGSIEQAHKPNEFIALEQLAACEAFLGKLCDWLCSEEALA